jgi:hypothetical protein
MGITTAERTKSTLIKSPSEIYSHLFKKSSLKWDQFPSGGWDFRRILARSREAQSIQTALLQGAMSGVSRGVRIDLPGNMNQIDLAAFLPEFFYPPNNDATIVLPYELPVYGARGINGRAEQQAGAGFSYGVHIGGARVFENFYGIMLNGTPTAILQITRLNTTKPVEVAVFKPGESRDLTFTTDYRSLLPKASE